ncbi:hypothetical protein [Vibrio quintilis]|uniref:Uncharacterized protein n=1 Tax=Vibrio quintilis TaxID=1117707 RepID=A0A1M7YUG6_9VIBR|nr:hypothetical protein [Vibrio quintilis]SHO56307.1 hypothetical protein VQ7734_02076 [Vibrio quintilis]
MYHIDDLIAFDRQEAARFLFEAVKNETLILKHPRKEMATYCRQSQRYGKANVILFSDQEKKNPWYMIQIYDLVNGYICEQEVVNPLNAGEISDVFNLIQKGEFQIDPDCGNTKLHGLLFSQVRPYHYMYDQFVNYFYLNEFGPVSGYSFTDENCFYAGLPEGKALKPALAGGCYLFPCTLGGLLNSKYDDQYAEQMHTFLRNDSEPKALNSELSLWFGITAQKRSWLEQTEGYCHIVRQLLNHYRSITVIIDGWTSFSGGSADTPKNINRDMAVFESIASHLSGVEGVTLINLIGKDYKEKISYSKSIDYFIANSGTGCMVPLMFTGSKGVIHTNGQLHTFERSYDERVRVVPAEKIFAQEDMAIDSGVYSTHWTVIYNLLIDLIGIDAHVPEKDVIKNKSLFTLKRFIFKKTIQIGTALKKIRHKMA